MVWTVTVRRAHSNNQINRLTEYISNKANITYTLTIKCFVLKHFIVTAKNIQLIKNIETNAQFRMQDAGG